MAQLFKDPASDGHFVQWTDGTGPPAYQQVDDGATPDEDTTYVGHATSGAHETFHVPNVSAAEIPDGSTINWVEIQVRARRSTGGTGNTIALTVSKGAVDPDDLSVGSAQTADLTYSELTRQMAVDPFTDAAWAVATLRGWTDGGATERAFGATTTGGGEIKRGTRVRVLIDYTLPLVVPAGLTTYQKNAIYNAVYRGASLSTPATYIALHTGNPGEAGELNEVVGGGYVRKQVNTDGVTSPFWTDPIDGVGTNAGDIIWPEATADWGTIKAQSIWDAPSGGNCLNRILPGTGRQLFVGLAGDDRIYCSGHGFVNDDKVVLTASLGGPLPTGLSEWTEHFVVGATTDWLGLSTTQGGLAIDLTGDGEGEIVKSGFKSPLSGHTPWGSLREFSTASRPDRR